VTGWTWYADEPWIVVAALLIGIAAAMLPGRRACEIDIVPER